MRKVIFEGIINGKKFDSVQEYNKEMNRLISSGSLNINASTNTRYVEENEQELRGEDTCKKGLGSFNPIRFLPLFNDDSTAYYLDLLVSEDDALNQNNINITSAKLDDDLANLKYFIDNKSINVSDAIGLLNAVKDIRAQITNDSKSNNSAAYELKKRIDEDTKRLKVVNNSTPIIKVVADYYNQAFNILKDYILNI